MIDNYADDNDGVLNGNLLEFKLRVNDLNAVLFQCVKAIFSALRIKGKPVPANIIIVDLNGGKWRALIADYLSDIGIFGRCIEGKRRVCRSCV